MTPVEFIMWLRGFVDFQIRKKLLKKNGKKFDTLSAKYRLDMFVMNPNQVKKVTLYLPRFQQKKFFERIKYSHAHWTIER